MTYRRVIPRDLFNEANLLKCFGQIYIALEKVEKHKARYGQDDVDSFDVVFREEDGSLTITNLSLTVSEDHDKPRFSEDEGDREYRFFRPLNARARWVLYAELVGDPDFDPVEVFTDEGLFTAEMLALIKSDCAAS